MDSVRAGLAICASYWQGTSGKHYLCKETVRQAFHFQRFAQSHQEVALLPWLMALSTGALAEKSAPFLQ